MKVTNDEQERQVVSCRNSVKSRIIWIDIAKAICIILVVVGHYIPDVHPAWYGVMRSVIYSFHMPLFMFASGFVYIATYRETSYADFLLRKIKRLMVPYFTVSVLVITIKLCTQGSAYVEHPVTPLSYLKIFYQPEAGMFLWFIWALWWMFVIIPFFNTRNSRLALFAISFFLLVTASSLPDIFCLRQFAGMLIYFTAGIVAYDWRRQLTWVNQVPLIVILAAFGFVEAMPFVTPINCNGQLIAFIGIAFVLKSSFVIGSKACVGKQKLTIISSASYIIYLLHTTFEGFAKALVVKLPYLSDLSNDTMFIIGAIFVISIGVYAPVWIYKHVLGRYRITKILFGLK